MSLVIISAELSSSNLSYPKGVVLDFSKTDECLDFLRRKKTPPLFIYDITHNKKRNYESIISVNDHINCTGSNPLVGRQKKLGIDFVDMNYAYKQSNDGVLTHSCGKKLDTRFKFPSHYLAHIVILARTLKFESIGAYLINNF